MSDTAETRESTDQIVAVIDRGTGRQIQVRLNEFKGKRYVDLRQFYLDEEQEIYKPTQKGVSIPVEQFTELKEALAKLENLL